MVLTLQPIRAQLFVVILRISWSKALPLRKSTTRRWCQRWQRESTATSQPSTIAGSSGCKTHYGMPMAVITISIATFKAQSISFSAQVNLFTRTHR
ncbi:hypothetical protein LINPERPRIM_LOCUS1606 [Linum perenne]